MNNRNLSNKHNIQFLQWNCRSLARNIIYLNQHLASKKYEVLLLQSLNVIPSKLPSIPGFYHPPAFEDRGENEKVQTAIYIREGLDYNLPSSPCLKNIIDIHTSSVTIRFHESLTLNIMSVYLPKGPNEQNTEWLSTPDIQQKGKWLIGGDFNAHSPFWEKDCDLVTSNRLVENIVDSPFNLLNDGSVTRIPDNPHHRSTAIDLSLISPELVPSCSWQTYSDPLGSDHLPIIVTLRNIHSHSNDNVEDKIPKYNYKKADWNRFQCAIAVQDFSTLSNENETVDSLFNTFKEIVLRAADLSIPKIKAIHRTERNGNIWWNEDCEKAVNNKKI